MLTLRRSEDRRHLKRGSSDTWMTFDPENQVDPLRRGFHALGSLNEERLGPEMGMHPHPPEDLEIITYVREGTLIHQDADGGMGSLGSGEFQRSSAGRGTPHRALNGSPVDAAHVFQSAIAAKGAAPLTIRGSGSRAGDRPPGLREHSQGDRHGNNFRARIGRDDASQQRGLGASRRASTP
jgi:redox-sensitive bicupin YhaK (pirin superfamily)